jgi:hypothetical protein
MFKVFAVLFILFFPLFVWAQDRLSIAKELTKMAQEAEVHLEFSVDPNNDTTLMLHRESNLKPTELSGDWTIYLLSIGSSPEQLKEKGFNKVRIYTSKSEGITDYVLKIL